MNILGQLLNPAHVAVIGASTRANTYGERSVRYFDKLGFSGEVTCVNPGRDRIGTFPCVRAVADLPDGIDMAVVAVARQHVPGTIGDLGRRGCRGAVILSAGFGESDAEGAALEAQVLAEARATGIRFFGPNTNGLVNVAGRVPLGVSSIMERRSLTSGPVAIVSQSGSIAAAVADRLMDYGCGLSYVLGIGNAVDIGLAETLQFLAGDASTQIVLAFIEGIGNAADVFAATRAIVAAGKLIVLVKVGRSDHGKAMAATHSGSVVGSWDAFRALAEASGAVVSETLEDAIGVCAVAARGRTAAAIPRLAVITMSGAVAGLVADEASRVGVALPEPEAPQTRDDIRSMGFRAQLNPLDFGQVQPKEGQKPDFRRICELFLADPAIDGLLLATGLTQNLQMVADTLGSLSAEASKPIYVYALGGEVAAPFRAALMGDKLPVFEDLHRALLSIRLGAPRAVVDHVAPPSAARDADVSPRFREAAARPTEFNLAQALGEHGLRFPASTLVQSRDEAVEAAADRPVALKVVGPKILHKAAGGLMRLPLTGADDVGAAWDSCRSAAERQGVWDGHAMVQDLIDLRGGIEVMMAARRDVEVGPILILAAGGAMVEALGAATVSALPETEEEADRALASNPALSAMLDTPARGLDRNAFIRAVLCFSQACRSALQLFDEIEVNPLVVLPQGQGAWALDAAGVARAVCLELPAEEPA